MRVQPIRDNEKIHEIEDRLSLVKTPRGRRMLIMFELGIHLGRRISDILPLRVKDLRGKDELIIKEKKTGKYINLHINQELRRTLKQLLGSLDGDLFVLESRCRRNDGARRPITRRTAYNDMKQLAREIGVNYNVGTHTLRKTFGYHYYQQTHDIGLLMKIFNHSNENITKRYIGIEQDEINKALRELKY
jgi:integrase